MLERPDSSGRRYALYCEADKAAGRGTLAEVGVWLELGEERISVCRGYGTWGEVVKIGRNGTKNGAEANSYSEAFRRSSFRRRLSSLPGDSHEFQRRGQAE